MSRSIQSRSISALLCILLFLCSRDLPASSNSEKALVLLETHCVECHGAKSTRNSFDLSTKESFEKAGIADLRSLPAKSSESLLIKKIKHTDEPGMPYKRTKLSDEEIATLTDWINEGAPFDRPLNKGTGEKEETWWSLKPLVKPTVPAVDKKQGKWARTPIDQFILAKLREKGFQPSEPADKRTLLRRCLF